MKITYITNLRIPTQKAHGLQIMKMCEKFSEFSLVELIVPKKENYLKEDPFDYYKIKKSFKIRTVPAFDFGGKTDKLAKFLFLLDFLIFGFSVIFFGKIKKEDVVYTRDYMLLPFLLTGKKIVEIHDIPEKKFLFSKILKKAKMIVVITLGLKKELISLGIPSEKIIVAPDGVDLEDFDIEISKEEARRRLSLPLDKKIILYSGQLYSWKGGDVLAKATKYLDESFVTVFVGGTLPWFSDFNKKYGASHKIKLIMAQKRELVPVFLKSADVLVLPNSGKEKISKVYTSPLKLFEYMASGRPIVSSDLPSIREILNETNASFFTPDDEKSLAEAIKKVFESYENAEKRAEQALKDAGKYSWKKRAENIIKAID